MVTKKMQDGVIINDCKNLGEHDNGFFERENPELHFDCTRVRYGVGRGCLFPFYIKNPRCCAGYTSGGEKKVVISNADLLRYYKEDFESTIITARGEKPDILKEI